MLRRVLAIGMLAVFLASTLGGIAVLLAAVTRVRDLVPEPYVFGQSTAVLAKLTHDSAVACVDPISATECASVDIVRQRDGGVFEIISYVPISQTANASYGPQKIVVSRTPTRLRRGRFCVGDDEEDEIEFFEYATPTGEIRLSDDLRPVSAAAADDFRETIGFAAHGWECMEYAEPPALLDVGALVRRGFKDGEVAGDAREVYLSRAIDRLKLARE